LSVEEKTDLKVI